MWIGWLRKCEFVLALCDSHVGKNSEEHKTNQLEAAFGSQGGDQSRFRSGLRLGDAPCYWHLLLANFWNREIDCVWRNLI